ncbi:MAG: Crp/Fnr family transcriptional regulator [Bacteroidota bacterium]
MDQIFTFFQHIHSVPEHILEEYLHHWQAFTAPKKTLLTEPGKVERYMYFVLEGVQKSYLLTEDKVHILAFTYAPSLSGIPESFFTQTPSPYFLETITHSRFLRISYEKHQAYMAAHREIETLFRKGVEQLLLGIMQRYTSLMHEDIETRFRNFLARSPHLLQMVPQKDLASYLRIDPTNFSKLINQYRT